MMRASNPEQWQELPVLTSHLDDSPQPSQPPQLGEIAVHGGPSVSKPSTQPSTSKQGCTGTKRKSRRRPSRRPAKSSKASNEVGNASPVDNVELPDIIITLDDLNISVMRSSFQVIVLVTVQVTFLQVRIMYLLQTFC